MSSEIERALARRDERQEGVDPPGPAFGRDLAFERADYFMLGLRAKLGLGQLLGPRAQAVADIVS